jgi:hypothetical protein
MSRFATVNLLDVEDSMGDRAPGIQLRFLAGSTSTRVISASATSASSPTCAATLRIVTASKKRPTLWSRDLVACC